jgi:hypothetical protein
MLGNAGSYRHGPALALFEAYNICGRGGWEGDLMAAGARLEGNVPVIPGRAQREPGIHAATWHAARWIPCAIAHHSSMLRIAPE